METEVSVPADEVENVAANKQRRVEKEPQATPAGLDFINNLPDDMLIVIISLLPIRNRARTAAVSRRWRTLWLRTPVDLLHAHKLCHGYRQSLDAFSQILGSHHGPIKGLIAGKFRSNGKERAKLDEWFRSRAIDQLEKLSYNDGHMSLLPTSVLRFAPTLRLTNFMNCHPPNDAPALFLPRLKHLELVVVCIPKDDMERLLRGCTALEFLRLQAMNWSSTLHIDGVLD